jgi:hypothetical protein
MRYLAACIAHILATLCRFVQPDIFVFSFGFLIKSPNYTEHTAGECFLVEISPMLSLTCYGDAAPAHQSFVGRYRKRNFHLFNPSSIQIDSFHRLSCV